MRSITFICASSSSCSPSTPSNKSLRAERGPEAGVRGIPSPFIKIYERGRDTPHPNLLPLVLTRKDLLDEILARRRARSRAAGGFGGVGILRPVVFRVPALQILLHFMIATIPKAHEIPGDLHGAPRR